MTSVVLVGLAMAVPAGAVAGGLTALGLLRYLDVRLVVWLLGVGRTSSLSPADQQEVSVEVARHVRASRQQVSRYADALAGGDPVLRARLRRLEGGVLP